MEFNLRNKFILIINVFNTINCIIIFIVLIYLHGYYLITFISLPLIIIDLFNETLLLVLLFFLLLNRKG